MQNRIKKLYIYFEIILKILIFVIDSVGPLWRAVGYLLVKDVYERYLRRSNLANLDSLRR